MYFAPDLNISLPYLSGPIDAAVWQEHQAEMGQLSAAMLLHAINDSEDGAILVAALAESKPLGRAAPVCRFGHRTKPRLPSSVEA